MIGRKLVIDALGYKKNKAYGYQEYLFNILDYFYLNRNKLYFDEIIIVCDASQCEYFEKYNDKLLINGYFASNLLLRIYFQMFFPFLLRLNCKDVILFTGNYSSLFKKCKYVLVIHDLLYLRKKLLPDFFIRVQRKIYVPRSVSIADYIITISDFTKVEVLKNIKQAIPSKICTVYNYFNFEKYLIVSDNSSNNIKNKYFLCVSSSAYHKNLIIILKAYEKYCQYKSEIDLCIVGNLVSGDAFSFYNLMNNTTKNRIHIFSNISNYELSKLYENCDAYLSATFFEGLGMPIVEAMFFNAPLILSDLDVCREVTNNHAIFFNPYYFEELYLILINYKKEKIDTRSFVLEKFSAANTSQKYIDILNSV